MISLLTVLTMIAFAANSLLCRMALKTGAIDPASFTAMRLGAGAVTLIILCFIFSKKPRSKIFSQGSWASSFALFGYAILFSLAYLKIDAGLGALTLFLLVQLTMIGWNRYLGNALHRREMTGLTLALAGLLILTLPGKDAPELSGLLMMATAGIFWGIYSLRGKSSSSPLEQTCGNFIRAVSLAILSLWLFTAPLNWTNQGLFLAFISGSVTSGLGYSLWYIVLRKISTTQASIAQLSVPALAVVGGIVFLGETWTLQKAVSAFLIFVGVLVAKR